MTFGRLCISRMSGTNVFWIVASDTDGGDWSLMDICLLHRLEIDFDVSFVIVALVVAEKSTSKDTFCFQCCEQQQPMTMHD